MVKRSTSEALFVTRNLRNLARNQQCMVRLPHICIDSPTNHSTTVLAHYRLAGVSGIGLKSPDLCGAWACSACHDAIDFRSRNDLSIQQIKLAHLEGVIRTLAAITGAKDSYAF